MSKSIRSFFTATPSNAEKRKSGGDQINELENGEEKPESVKLPTKKAKKESENNETSVNEVELAGVEVVKNVEESLDIPLCGWQPFDSMEPGWRSELIKEYSKPYFRSLLQFVQAEIKSKTVYPPADQVFTAFNLCPLDNIKVVVIGQDPYHGAGQAHGLAFSVQKGIALPPSLKNMILEAKVDVKISDPKHGNLECWSRQGVLMLNTALTVRSGEPFSHSKKGWEDFTDAVVKVLSKKKNIVYLLWGNPAKEKCKGIDSSCNTMITTSHPSPLGARKTDKPFIGSKCFSRCNDALIAYGKDPIDWRII